MGRQLASILVGDHLGQVKKISWPSGEIATLTDLGEPNTSKPIVSIEPINENCNKYLICNKSGELYIYDSVRGKTKQCSSRERETLVKALPFGDKDVVYVFEKHLSFDYSNRSDEIELRLKKGKIQSAKVCLTNLALVGKDIPLRVFDVKTRNKIFEASPFERDWLRVIPECDIVSVDFVGPTRIVTCAKSDSVIRVYDINSSKTTPVISIEMNQTAFNEYAEAGRFMSVASASDCCSSSTCPIVVGSNVGQLIAIDLRFNVKQEPKKRLQPRNYRILGGFKGARGATFKDIKIVAADEGDNKADYKVISCCLDRYIRVHNLSRTTGRYLDKHVYLKTKPTCCSPVFYQDKDNGVKKKSKRN